MSLPSINFLHLTVSEIQPGQTISRRPPTRPHAHPDTMGENNTPTALKGCEVKNWSVCNSIMLVHKPHYRQQGSGLQGRDWNHSRREFCKNALPTFLVGESRDQLRDLVGEPRDQLRGDDVRGRVLLSWPVG